MATKSILKNVHIKNKNMGKSLLRALEDAEKQTVSTLIDIKVLPKTMLHGYGHWWRVGQPQVSKSETVRKAYEALKVELAKARQY